MAVAVEASGSQTATIGTEHTLSTPTTAKTRVLRVDLSPLLAGDVVELRVYSKVLTGSTLRVEKRVRLTFHQVASSPNVETVPSVQPFGGSFRLVQVAGTGRTLDWSVCTLD